LISFPPRCLRPNLLLLDEPTNNLDLDAIHALGEAVKAYEGAVLIASHDISFVSETCEEVYYINNGEVSRLEGGVLEYKDIVQAAVAKQKKIIT
jgi:ATPase subunit of ABC transporter with duplicated ATPase domains